MAKKASEKHGKGEKKVKKAEKKAKKQTKKLMPKAIKTGKGASPFEIGKAVVEAFNKGTPEHELWKAHWSKKCRSIEGFGVSMAWDGMKAVAEKGREWMSTHKVHSARAEGPYVGATGFSIAFAMDVEDTTTGKREMMNEVGVYTVQGGKIVQEEFMYRV